jgi:phenylalanyl-tRNA synthetase beta chain
LFGGLEAIAYNINRKNNDLKLFEFGRTYRLEAAAAYTETKHLTLFATGSLFGQNPYGLNHEANFAYLKSVVVALLEKCGITSYKSADSTYTNFETGLCYLVNNKPLVELGGVSKKQLKQFDIHQAVYYACFDWSSLVKTYSKNKIEFVELSKFPAVKRDLALLIDKSVTFTQIEELAFSTERKLLKEVSLFDVYEHEKLGNKKSYAVSFTLLNNEATLTDKQIDAVMDKLIVNYKEKLGAELR